MADKQERKRGLGRGLSALMADVAETESVAAKGAAAAEQFVPIERIKPNPDQPRKRFEQEHLDDLAASIKEKGVIQPLIVRALDNGNFEIVAGERRWRASQIAKIHSLPVIVREFTDVEVLEVAIIENIQRADLNAIEEAAGYKQLMFRFGHTQEKIAEALGKSRSHIANLLRLLNLPEGVQEHVRNGELSAGHARTLVTARDPETMAQQIMDRKLSVRQAEALLRAESQPPRQRPDPASYPMEKDADTRALEGDLSAAVGMKVSISNKPGAESGTLTISYNNFEQLDALCMILSSAR